MDRRAAGVVLRWSILTSDEVDERYQRSTTRSHSLSGSSHMFSELDSPRICFLKASGRRECKQVV